MDDQLTISTPEQVAFHYERAGIGSRFMAGMLDYLIIGVIELLLFWGASLLMGGIIAGGGDQTSLNITLAFVVIIYFLVFWGYFALFELVWNGQTPGKRSGNLRVIRRDGQPIRASEAIIRNLVRIVDMLPGFYGVGLTVMFIDKEDRRLGDMAAGTIVVHEPLHTRLYDVRVSDAGARARVSGVGGQTISSRQPSPVSAGPLSARHSATRSPMPRNAYDPLPGISLREISPDDYRLAREMVARARRGELSRERSRQLAVQLAQGIASRMGHDFREWQARGWDPVVFLEAVLIARDARDL
jgi:uncharacterized RDD family membrane protein YckC